MVTALIKFDAAKRDEGKHRSFLPSDARGPRAPARGYTFRMILSDTLTWASKLSRRAFDSQLSRASFKQSRAGMVIRYVLTLGVCSDSI